MVLYYPRNSTFAVLQSRGRTADRTALVAMKPAIISGMAMLVMVDRGGPLQ